MITEGLCDLSRYKWLGGLVEIGAGLGYTNYERKGRIYSYPYIHLNDNSENKIVQLKSLLGGRKISKQGNSWEWRLEGEKVADLLINTKPYAPSRLAIIESFEDWVVATRVEREEIAKGFPASYRSDVSEADYNLLLNFPEFFAGVLDGRGAGYLSRGRIRFTITSSNRVLLGVIANRFGVTVQTSVKNTGGISYGLEISDQQKLEEINELTKSFRV